MDSLERDRDAALVSLANSIRRCLKTGVTAEALGEYIKRTTEYEAMRLRVAKAREKGAGK